MSILIIENYTNGPVPEELKITVKGESA